MTIQKPRLYVTPTKDTCGTVVGKCQALMGICSAEFVLRLVFRNWIEQWGANFKRQIVCLDLDHTQRSAPGFPAEIIPRSTKWRV